MISTTRWSMSLVKYSKSTSSVHMNKKVYVKGYKRMDIIFNIMLYIIYTVIFYMKLRSIYLFLPKISIPFKYSSFSRGFHSQLLTTPSAWAPTSSDACINTETSVKQFVSPWILSKFLLQLTVGRQTDLVWSMSRWYKWKIAGA